LCSPLTSFRYLLLKDKVSEVQGWLGAAEASEILLKYQTDQS